MALEGKRCACGCGRSAFTEAGYHTDCRVPCKCGCGFRARYAYAAGHRPTTVCTRCGKKFAKLGGRILDYCSQCARHVADGRPAQRDEALSYARAKQKNAPEGRRWCSGCQKYRLHKFFAQSAGVYRSRCKPCAREQSRARLVVKNFNITPEQYLAIKELQGGKCFICQIATGATKALSVDHDHACCALPGKSCGSCVRGLLCSTCNNILGFARDQPWLFFRAVTYLENPPAREILGD